jgi:hypothetical protein
VSGNQCHCGKPIQDTGNLCPACGELLRRNLHKIADRWPELEMRLAGLDPTVEQGKTKNAMIAAGTELNEAAVRARRACTDAVWFTLQVIRDDLDTAGRPFTPPPTSANRSQDDTPRLARWIATWHVGHITHRTDPESAHEIARDVERAERLTFEVCELDYERKIPTGMPCENHGTTPDGERAPCAGVMVATLGDQMPDLVCSEDATHRIPPDVWSRNYWKRAHTMDEGAARRLAERITG